MSSKSASKLKREAAKAEKAAKKAGIDTSKKVELDVHGNVVVQQESGTSDAHKAQLEKLAEQVDQFGISDRVVRSSYQKHGAVEGKYTFPAYLYSHPPRQMLIPFTDYRCLGQRAI